jgi:O-antigen ligase
MINGKGSFVAPLFFLALGLACAGSRFGYVAPWALCAITLALASRIGAGRTPAPTSLSFAVYGYAALAVLSTLLFSPAYTPAGLYHPVLLVLAFHTARSLDEDAERAAMHAALALGVILAFWGLAQVGYQGMARAQSTFETPATYSATINLMLVPMLAAVILGKRGMPLLSIVLLLAAATFAADSRGGLVALIAGLGLAVIFAIRVQRLRPRTLGLALALLAAGWFVATALRALPSGQVESAPSSAARAESSLSRLELYALSWEAWRERPLTGTGYLSFRHTLEQGRAKVPSYGESNETWFVHNDYLQTLQELGPLGFLALLGLTALPLLLAYRRLPALAEKDWPAVVACAAGLGAMTVHALVDFPFYIPVCLLLYGALLGTLDRRLSNPVPAPAWQTKPWYRPVRAGAIAVVAVVLMRPVLAEAAAEWGLRQSAAGEGQTAAFWLGAAQRIDPGDWRYHWYAGQFWDAQAADSGRREAARLAAAAYEAGFSANSLDVRNLLGKISVHRRHRQLLDAPADPGTLRQWEAQALALAPRNPAVRRELGR